MSMRTRAAVGILALALVPVSLAPPSPSAAVTPPDTTPATITGAVVGPDGLPATGVTVTATRYGGTYSSGACQTRTARTVDATGHYTFGGLVPGVYALGFEGGMDFVDRAASPDQRGDFVVAAPGSTVTAPTTALPWAAKISGRTRTAQGVGLRARVWLSGSPIRGNQPKISYGTNGRFVVGGLVPGYYFLVAGGVGKYLGQTYWSSYYSRTRTRIATVAHRTTVLRDMVLKVGVAVTGRVTDRYGHPVVGATVTVWGGIGPDVRVQKVTRTNYRGRYTVTGLTPTFTVMASKLPALLERSVTSHGTPGRTAYVNVALTRRAPAASTIWGIVTLPDGTPAVGVPVTVVAPRDIEPYTVRLVRTTSTGSYRVGQLPPATYRVQFGGSGSAFLLTSSAWFTNGAGQARRLDGHVTMGGTISGVVRGVDGAGLDRGTVYTQSTSSWATTSTAVGGRYTLLGLPPDDYTVSFGACGHDYQYWDGAPTPATAARITVAAGSTVTGIDAELTALATVSGRVIGPDGRGIAGATVLLTSAGHPARGATAGASGAYVVAATVSAGDYVITATPPATRPDLVTTAYGSGAPVTITPGEFLTADVVLQAAPPA